MGRGRDEQRRAAPGGEPPEDDDTLWVFGYGSLVWRPAFPHLARHAAWIEGFARRFWQASTDHRGVPERPGRVVTLLHDDDDWLHAGTEHRPSPCWGSAYAIPRDDPDRVLPRLDHRERAGYERVELDVHLVAAQDVAEPGAAAVAEDGSAPEPTRTVRGLVYIAGPGNENFVGPAPIDAIARQVAGARGPSGANPEYVFELARHLRAMRAEDDHVFAVAEALARVLGEDAPIDRRERVG